MRPQKWVSVSVPGGSPHAAFVIAFMAAVILAGLVFAGNGKAAHIAWLGEETDQTLVFHDGNRAVFRNAEGDTTFVQTFAKLDIGATYRLRSKHIAAGKFGGTTFHLQKIADAPKSAVPHTGDVVGRAVIKSTPILTQAEDGSSWYAFAIATNNHPQAEQTLAYMKGIAVPGELGKPPQCGDEVEVVMPAVLNFYAGGWHDKYKRNFARGWIWRVQPAA